MAYQFAYAELSAVVGQEGGSADIGQNFELAVKLYGEGIKLRAPGNLVNFRLYDNRSGCQWTRHHCAHAVLDAAIAAQLDCAESDLWQPAYNSGRAWQLMGIYTSAVKVRTYHLPSAVRFAQLNKKFVIDYLLELCL